MPKYGEKIKIIVAHPGRQHSFRLAKGLKKEDMLFKYITTVYYKKGSWTKKVTRFLKGDNVKRANSRVCKDIEESDVIQFEELNGLILLLLIRINNKKLLSLWGRYTFNSFGKKVAKYAIANKVDAVIMYDTTANKCFEILKKKAPHIKRIMDVSAANRIYMKHIYDEDMQRCSKFADRLYRERKFLWNDRYILTYKDEIELTQFFIVPSYFVKKSIEFSGIVEKQISVCPYGVDIEKFNVRRDIVADKKILNFIYIGNVTQMKGIYYLLEAMKSFDKNQVKLTIVGDYDNTDGVFNEYISNYEFVGRVTHDQIVNLCANSDIMIFPSLGEGFSLAILECLASGLPVVCTKNSGANDIIKDGYNGFVISAGSIEDIERKIKWFIDNKNKIPQMSNNARKTAEIYSWNLYEKTVARTIREMICNS